MVFILPAHDEAIRNTIEAIRNNIETIQNIIILPVIIKVIISSRMNFY